jgi:RNA polymerase sigma factor (sigma-70 family)
VGQQRGIDQMTEYERDLWRRYREGDEEAFDKLLLTYLPYVKGLTTLLHKEIERVDLRLLMNAGTVGLWKAMRGFNYEGSVKFTTYAYNFIRGEIFATPEVHGTMPRRQRENYVKLMEAQKRLAQRVEGKPTFAEVAEEAGLTVEQAKLAQDARNIAFPVESIDHQGDQASSDHSDEGVPRRAAAFEKATPEPEIALADTHGQNLETAIRKLSKLEASIITGSYWGGETDAQIAKRFGFALTKTRKIRQRAVEKLRVMLVEGSSDE